MKKPTCETGLKKNVISKNVFEREIKLCQQLNKENDKKGCGSRVACRSGARCRRTESP
jgi:hypothetical protein